MEKGVLRWNQRRVPRSTPEHVERRVSRDAKEIKMIIAPHADLSVSICWFLLTSHKLFRRANGPSEPRRNGPRDPRVVGTTLKVVPDRWSVLWENQSECYLPMLERTRQRIRIPGRATATFDLVPRRMSRRQAQIRGEALSRRERTKTAIWTGLPSTHRSFRGVMIPHVRHFGSLLYTVSMNSIFK